MGGTGIRLHRTSLLGMTGMTDGRRTAPNARVCRFRFALRGARP
jgi:hypothetical protein